MKRQDVLLFLNLLNILVLVYLADSVEENCYRGDQYYYNNPCAGQDGQADRLSLCDKGQKLAASCTESCEFCDPGTYADQKNNCLRCKPCLTECPEGQVIIQQCTLERDAVCGCPMQQCPTNPQPTCPSCPVVTPCPTLPKPTDSPETSSEPEVLLQFTKECPLPIEKLTDDVGTNISVSWEEPEATYGSMIAYQSYKPGHQFPIGHFKAVYVFANSSGATIACSFPVSVKASVSATSLPVSDPPEGNILSYVIGFVVGVVFTILILVLLWSLCYCAKSPFLRKVCPHHQMADEEDLKDDCQNPLLNGQNPCGNGANLNDCNHIPPVQNDQENHMRAAGNLAQANEEGNGSQNQDAELVSLLEKNPETEPKNNQQNSAIYPGDVSQAIGGQQDHAEENEPENSQQNGTVEPSDVGPANGGQQDHTIVEEMVPRSNQQNGAIVPSDVGPTNGGQQDHTPVEDAEAANHQQSGEVNPSNDGQASVRQEDHPAPTEDSSQQSLSLPPQSSSLPNYSALFVDLPPENSPSTSTNTPSQLVPLTSQGNQELDGSLQNTPQSLTASESTSLQHCENVEKLKNPDVEVTQEDIDELADMVVKNSDYYVLKDTFLRRIIGYDTKRGLEVDVEKEKTDPNTKLVQYLIQGWLKKEHSRKRSDLVAKIGKFNKSLEREFIIYLNRLDES